MVVALAEVDALSAKNWRRLQESGADLSLYKPYHEHLKRILGLSDYVADHLIRKPRLLDILLEQKYLFDPAPDYHLQLAEALKDCQTEQHLWQILRNQRNLHMVRIAWRDLLNMQSIERSLAQVSELADELIGHSYRFLYAQLCQRYGTPMGQHGPQPLLIIGMGKLGGKELNFSSDIDLIFCYPQNGEIKGNKSSVEHQQFFTKLAQKLISSLHQTTAEGQVFRVDMRLRPFGESGPLVTQLSALEDYLQDQGREWERYAMNKARVINGDSKYAEALEEIITPFTYRRYLDFGAIDALRKMKQLISQEVRRRGLTNNIKLGAGGIREVEFIVQSFQLIRGGREQALQSPSLLPNLQYLADIEVLTDEEASQLKNDYLFLRKVEHCLQQFADQQTQTLPEDELNQQRLCRVFDCNSYSEFQALVEQCQNSIHEQFHLLIGEQENDASEQSAQGWQDSRDLWQLELTEEEACQILSHWLPQSNCQLVATYINNFKQTVARKGIGQKGRDTLNDVIPELLRTTLVKQPDTADISLNRTLQVIEAVLGRTTYLQLLSENDGALNQLVRLCSVSPWITQQLRNFPILLDELLNPASLYQPTPLQEYRQELRQSLLRIDADDLEQQMESLRQYKLSQQLRIAAADVTEVMPVMKVSDHLTALAEAVIEEVVSMAWQHLVQRHGVLQGTSPAEKHFAVIGYGKLGGIELGYGSDLDLVFVHNVKQGVMTEGPKEIASNHFYTKLAQRIMHLFNTKTGSGQLYEVDLRLRPSGSSGLLACHINGFEQYQRNEAWTWEHQAIVRARTVYGEATLAEKISRIRHNVLMQPRDKQQLQIEVVKMREKMRQHLTKPHKQNFDLKQDPGGITDIEFLVQYFMLLHAPMLPALTKYSDNVRIIESLHHAGIIEQAIATKLIEAYLTFRNLNHHLALQQRDVQEYTAELRHHQQNVLQIWDATLPRI